jgi:hypothetical protein
MNVKGRACNAVFKKGSGYNLFQAETGLGRDDKRIVLFRWPDV